MIELVSQSSWRLLFVYHHQPTNDKSIAITEAFGIGDTRQFIIDGWLVSDESIGRQTNETGSIVSYVVEFIQIEEKNNEQLFFPLLLHCLTMTKPTRRS